MDPPLQRQQRAGDGGIVTPLFDSQGKYIAFLVDDRLYSAATTIHIGRYHPQVKAFSDLVGFYFGELLAGDRLLYNELSPARFTNFGSLLSQGSYRPPSAFPTTRITLPYGYRDVDPTKLG